MSKVAEKWRGAGLLEGLTEEQQEIVARGLENQAAWCISYGVEKANFLLPLAKAVMIKVLDHLVCVSLPAFLDSEGNAATVMSGQYRLKIASEDVSNVDPIVLEKLAASMAAELLADKGQASKIYLYTPILLFPSSDLSYMTMYRAAFR